MYFERYTELCIGIASIVGKRTFALDYEHDIRALAAHEARASMKGGGGYTCLVSQKYGVFSGLALIVLEGRVQEYLEQAKEEAECPDGAGL